MCSIYFAIGNENLHFLPIYDFNGLNNRKNVLHLFCQRIMQYVKYFRRVLFSIMRHIHTHTRIYNMHITRAKYSYIYCANVEYKINFDNRINIKFNYNKLGNINLYMQKYFSFNCLSLLQKVIIYENIINSMLFLDSILKISFMRHHISRKRITSNRS